LSRIKILKNGVLAMKGQILPDFRLITEDFGGILLDLVP
jgi:hypothetical protein